MKLKFKSKLLMIGLIPGVLIALALLVVATSSMRMHIVEEKLNTLHATARGIAFDTPQNALEVYKNELGIDVTVFEDKTRIRSTVEGAVDTDADPTIYSVVRSGKDYSSTNANVNGVEFFGYYIPLYDEDQNFIGMSFAGMPSAEAEQIIQATMKNMITASGAVILVVVVIVLLVARHMTKLMGISTELIGEVAKGNFTVRADKKVSGDEIGDIYKQAGALAESLSGSISNITDVADSLVGMASNMDASMTNVTESITQINKAVEEIAKGAMEQANNVQNASNSMECVNSAVVEIQKQLADMENTASQMQAIEADVMTCIDDLKSINTTTGQELADVEDKVAKTSEAINAIQEAMDIIKNISSETNLLSLNAAIEAARAGEAGRGFAVVAAHVSKLAKESDIASGDIEEILNTLLESCADMTASVKRLVDNMSKQSANVDDTYKSIQLLDSNISEAVKGIGVINQSCGEATALSSMVVDAFNNLASISQENAAGCEETNASTEELGATIEMVNSEASKLNGVASQLVDQVAIFKV